MTGRGSFLNAVKWSYVTNWGEKVFATLFIFLLAGILGPHDFGVASIALIYIGFLQLFVDQGFTIALIQKRELEGEHLDSVFWLDQALSAVLVAVSFLLSGWWATRNNSPELRPVISVLSVSIPIVSLSLIQAVLIKKEMNFKVFAICANVSTVIGGAVGISMAFAGFGVWSLVGHRIARDVVVSVILWRSSSWRPRLRFSWPHLRDLMSLSISNFMTQLALFAEGETTSILLGVFFGPVAVGLYRLADRLMFSVVSMTTASIQSVSLPEFSRFQNNPEELRKSVLTCIRLSSGITLPALAGLAAVSAPLMAFIGPDWIPAAPLLKLLCGLGAALMYAFFTGPLLQALSRSRQNAVLEWGRVLLGTAILVAAAFMIRNESSSLQLIGIGLARFISGALIVAPVFVCILMRLSQISVRQFADAIAPGALAAAGVLVSVMLLGSAPGLAGIKPVFVLASGITLGAVVGTTILLSLEKQLRAPIMDFLGRGVRRNIAERIV